MMRRQIAAHFANGSWSAEVADDRNHQIVGFELPHSLVILFVREKTVHPAFAVVRLHQIRVCRRSVESVKAAYRVVQGGTVFEERRVDITEILFIVVAQSKPAKDPFEIVSEQAFVALDFLIRLE